MSSSGASLELFLQHTGATAPVSQSNFIPWFMQLAPRPETGLSLQERVRSIDILAKDCVKNMIPNKGLMHTKCTVPMSKDFLDLKHIRTYFYLQNVFQRSLSISSDNILCELVRFHPWCNTRALLFCWKSYFWHSLLAVALYSIGRFWHPHPRPRASTKRGQWHRHETNRL